MKLDIKTLILSVVVSMVAAITIVKLSGRSDSLATGGSRQSTYDRVLASGTIRCGYVPYPPGLIKDPNTGKISGVFADTIQEAATNLGLKVDWTEEVGWGTMIEGLSADRYDAICSPVWSNSTRGKVADFTVPLFFSGIGAYVRTDDHRFDSSLLGVNDSAIKIATIDGEMSAIIASKQFSQASTVSLPQTADDSQLLLNITDNKADITFVEPYIADLFLKNHRGAVRNVVPNEPLRVFGNTIMISKGEAAFKSMLDTALSEIVNSGDVNRYLQKYTGGDAVFYPVALPYRAPDTIH